MKLGIIRKGPNIEEVAKAYAQRSYVHCAFENENDGGVEEIEFAVNCMARCDRRSNLHILIVTLRLSTGFVGEDGTEKMRFVKAYIDYTEVEQCGDVFTTIDDIPE